MRRHEYLRTVPVRRVALIIPDLLPLAGAERIKVGIAADQAARGYGVDFVFLDESKDVSGAIPPDCRVFNLDKIKIRDCVLPLARYLRAERPEAVLASIWPVTVLAILANFLAGSPSRVLVSDHNTLSLQYLGWGWLHRRFLKASIGLAYPHATARIAVSEGVARDVAQLGGLKPDRFHVIYNPLALPDATEKGRRLAAAAWKGHSGARLLTVGRLKPQKNHKLLLQAFRSLLKHRDARLVILGTGELERETRQEIKALGLEGKAFLAGHVTDVAAFYESADVFVLSSDYEGFGNVIVEAMSSGLQVVSTDCLSGPSEILDGGRLGWLVPVGDSQALSNAMLEALEKPIDRDRLIQRAAEVSGAHAFERYSELLHGDGEAVSTGLATTASDAAESSRLDEVARAFSNV